MFKFLSATLNDKKTRNKHSLIEDIVLLVFNLQVKNEIIL